MQRTRFRLTGISLSCALALLVAACGDSDSGTTPDPDPPGPEPVASVEVSPATSDLSTGETVQLSATLRDAAGATLTGRSVTWSSSDAGVASVLQTGLVTGVGDGTATVTATSEGRSGTASVAVTLASFTPANDTQISGSVNYADVTIPDGVTVTVTGDLNLSAAGSVDIGGSLVGDCVAMTITGNSTVALTGDISNACATDPGANAPGLTIVGNGDLTIDGVAMTSSGAVDIKNDPTMSAAPFEMAAITGILPIANKQFNCTIMNYTVVTGVIAPAGFAGSPDGDPGYFGYGFAFGCNGDLAFKGNVQIEAESGGDGGEGTDEGARDVRATGGAGGQGGLVQINASGNMTFTHETQGEIRNHFFAGDGGDGGDAIATALEVGDGAQAPSATAIGGPGGMAGAVNFQVGGDLVVAEDAVFAGPGYGGWGGLADAFGADGEDATAANDPAQIGGSATATGGAGGDAPGLVLLVLGDSETIENIVFDDGADGGSGGVAIAVGGIGGDGIEVNKPGAAGGAMMAQGGIGGDAGSGFGGGGGPAFFSYGTGGNGFIDCQATIQPGGAGGMGGAASGGDGMFGSGLNPGAPGGVEVDNAGNGGDGGDGEAPGGGGPGGNDAIASIGTRVEVGDNFTMGVDGNPCHSGQYLVQFSVLTDPDGHWPFLGLSSVSFLQIELSNFDADGSSDITISGTSPWVTLTGRRDADGSFDVGGFGVLAGNSNVEVTMSGMLACTGDLSAQMEVGGNGALPGGNPTNVMVSAQQTSSTGQASPLQAPSGCGLTTVGK